MLDLTFGEQVKIILSRKGMTIKELAEIIEEKTGKKMSRQNLTQRLGRDNFQEQDMRMIAEILECPFQLSILADSLAAERAANIEDIPPTEEELEKLARAKERKKRRAGKAAAGAAEKELTIGDYMDIDAALRSHESENAAEAAEELQPQPESYVEAAEEAQPESDTEAAKEAQPESDAEAVEEAQPEGYAEAAAEVRQELAAEAIEEAQPEEDARQAAEKRMPTAWEETASLNALYAEAEAEGSAEETAAGEQQREAAEAEAAAEAEEAAVKETAAEPTSAEPAGTAAEQASLERRPEPEARREDHEHHERKHTGWRAMFPRRAKKEHREEPETGRESVKLTAPEPEGQTGIPAGKPEPAYRSEPYRSPETRMPEEIYPEPEDEEAEDLTRGEVNPYTGHEYESNSVRMHPKRIGYVQVYDRRDHAWTDMTEWAFLGYQERKKALLGKDYEEPIYLD